MSGHHPFRELTKDVSPARQARMAEKVRQLKHAMALAALQHARQQSQADLAARHPPHACGTGRQSTTTRRRCDDAHD